MPARCVRNELANGGLDPCSVEARGGTFRYRWPAITLEMMDIIFIM
jgi:hypothetical protein